MIRYLRDRNYRSVKPLGEGADGSRAGAADGADAGADALSRFIDFVVCFVFLGHRSTSTAASGSDSQFGDLSLECSEVDSVDQLELEPLPADHNATSRMSALGFDLPLRNLESKERVALHSEDGELDILSSSISDDELLGATR